MTRDKWASKVEFLLACIGYGVGIGHIWKFPYLCYRYGGSAFLIPYSIMLVYFVTPLLYMEMAVGQLTRVGPVHAIAMLCPILKGVGIAIVMLCLFWCTIHNVINAWTLHYFFDSFKNPLPWKFCGSDWSDELCLSGDRNDSTTVNVTAVDANDYGMAYEEFQPPRESASSQYYHNYVLKISNGIEDGGGLSGSLVGFLFLAWTLCYLCIFKGVRSIGKVAYLTALLPYIALLVLLVRSVTLPGAIDGLRHFLIPRWSELGNSDMWVAAATECFDGVGISLGSLMVYSSYNNRRNNIYLDTLIISLTNIFTSLLAGCMVFSVLGVLANTRGVAVPDVVTPGLDLVYIAIPSLFADLPGSNIWGIIFFLMLIFLGIGSQFSVVEVISTTIIDHFKMEGILKNIRWKREIISLAVCFVCFLLGLIYVTRAGIYYLMFVDAYAGYTSVMIVAYFKVMAICWFFGGNRLAREISFLSGRRPYYWFPFCWVFISPVLISAVTLAQMERTALLMRYRDYVFPEWTNLFGILIWLFILAWIPIGVLHEMYKNGNGPFYASLIKSVTPSFVPEHVTRKSAGGYSLPTTEERSATAGTESNRLITGNEETEDDASIPVQYAETKGM